MAQTGLTQALSVSAFGFVILAIDVLCLGQIVDLFTYYATTWELENIYMKQAMSQMIVFSTWFYTIIFIIAWLFVAYPIIFVIKRHRYMDVEGTSANEEMYMGGSG